MTWNGVPASGAVVGLSSKAHNLPAVGNADADGRFTLTTWETSGLKATIVEEGPNELSFDVFGPSVTKASAGRSE